mgnify:FL=1
MKGKLVKIIIGTSFCFIITGIVCQSLKRQISSRIMNVTLMDSLINTDADVILLTIGHSECNACQKLRFNRKIGKVRVAQEYFDITSDINNKLLGQVLSTKGFPSTYVFNKDLQLQGIVTGMIHRETRLLTVCESPNSVFDLSIADINKSDLPGVLAYAFKALLSYWDGDIDTTEANALKSLTNGSYFFNNYLLFLVYKGKNDYEKMLFYKKQALQYTSSTDKIIYEDLLRQLEE